METLVEAMNRMQKGGYSASCRAEKGGLCFTDTGDVYAPEDLQVDEEVRIEGTSSPAEETLLLAVRARDSGRRGMYCVAFGNEMAAIESDMILRLRKRKVAVPN